MPLPTYGLYVHIPVCARLCRYCDFHSVPQKGADLDPLLHAIALEHHLLRKRELTADSILSSLYIGGGTPSIIPPDRFTHFAATLLQEIPVPPGTEFTLECNPESFSSQKLTAWIEAGVNRLSIGIQSLNDRELSLCGRPHTATQALSVLNDPSLAAIGNISVDLIKGLPGQTVASLCDSLSAVLAVPQVRHISLYDLTIAETTPFGRHRTRLPVPSDDTLDTMTQASAAILARHGFGRYEVSNWAKQGFESRHNSAYWHHTPYLGVGPSAHSFVNNRRWANTTDHVAYRDAISRGEPLNAFYEQLSPNEIALEVLALSLRTTAGLSYARYEEQTGTPFLTNERTPIVDKLRDDGLLHVSEDGIKPTDAGMERADGMARLLA